MTDGSGNQTNEVPSTLTRGSAAGDLPRRIPAVIGLLFFMSGMSGLIYEVIWTRVLLTVFGATIYAVATVLAAFMGGLALGSAGGGRLADRLRRPLRAYGLIELVVAGTALAVPWALDLFDPLYRALYGSGGAATAGEPSFFGLSLIRFAVSFLVLLVPTTCMGATLPVMARFLVRRAGRQGSRIGGLYAANTAGAVSGTFLAGFVLIASLGVHGSMVAAAALSCCVGVTALLLSRSLEGSLEGSTARRSAVDHDSAIDAAIGKDIDGTGSQSAEVASGTDPSTGPRTRDEAVATPPWLVRLIVATYAGSGFAALALQVLWSRTLVFRFDVLKNTTYSFSAMLTVFLIGLAAGSALMTRVVDRQRDPVRLYGLLQVLTGLTAALSLVMLVTVVDVIELPGTYDAAGGFSWLHAVGNVLLRTSATILVPTLLMGMAFPLAARLVVRRLDQVGKSTGRLYAWNTLGAILGSFSAGFLLIPVLGLARGMLVLGAVYVAMGTLVLVAAPGQARAARAGWALLGAVLILLLAVASPGRAPFQQVFPGHTIVTDEQGDEAYIEGPLATVAVMESSIGDRTIYIDNVSVAGTDRILLTDQKSLAHVPMLLLDQPRSALTVGFGSGGASWSFLQYRELEQVDCIEISPTVPQLAHTLRASNHGLLDAWDRHSPLGGRRFHDGRYRVLLDDARSYLRFSGHRYDIIATDCTDLRYKSNANLYDVEYFELCRQAITDDGMVVVWMPLGGMAPDVFACAIRTFAHVFPDMTIWYMNNEPTHYLLLLGTRQPLRIRLDRMLERISRPEIRADLAEVSLQQPEKILSCFLTNAPAAEDRLAKLSTELNTEDNPFLEFESPKYGVADEPLLANLHVLALDRRPVLPYIEDADEHPDLTASLARFVEAVDPILEGHTRLRHLQLVEAARSYLRAQAICPEDEAVRFLLRFDELRRRVARFPADAWSTTTLAEIALVRGRVEEARRGFQTAYRLTAARRDRFSSNLCARSILGLAECYLYDGQPLQGLRLLDQNLALLAGRPELDDLQQRLEGAAEDGDRLVLVR